MSEQDLLARFKETSLFSQDPLFWHVFLHSKSLNSFSSNWFFLYYYYDIYSVSTSLILFAVHICVILITNHLASPTDLTVYFTYVLCYFFFLHVKKIVKWKFQSFFTFLLCHVSTCGHLCVCVCVSDSKVFDWQPLLRRQRRSCQVLRLHTAAFLNTSSQLSVNHGGQDVTLTTVIQQTHVSNRWQMAAAVDVVRRWMNDCG